MNQNRRLKLLGWALATTVGAFLASLVSIFLLLVPAPQSPPPLVVSECRGAASGTRRINSDFGTQFDVSEKDFKVRTEELDSPPGTLYFVLIKDRRTNLVIWRDDIIFDEFRSAFPVFSEYSEVREVRTSKGRAVGEEHWGYLSGERWRYVRFSWGDVVGYRPTSRKEAGLLDQVINSACIQTAFDD
jgi:hypothetical protein